MTKQTCTDHCATCGQHFHGLTAFDRHRQDGVCHNPETATRKNGQLGLQVWTADGYCNKEAGCWRDGRLLHWLHPVIVWQGAETLPGAILTP